MPCAYTFKAVEEKQLCTLLKKVLPPAICSPGFASSFQTFYLTLDYNQISLPFQKMYTLPLFFALVVSVSSQDVSSLVASLPACEVRSMLRPILSFVHKVI